MWFRCFRVIISLTPNHSRSLALSLSGSLALPLPLLTESPLSREWLHWTHWSLQSLFHILLLFPQCGILIITHSLERLVHFILLIYLHLSPPQYAMWWYVKSGLYAPTTPLSVEGNKHAQPYSPTYSNATLCWTECIHTFVWIEIVVSAVFYGIFWIYLCSILYVCGLITHSVTRFTFVCALFSCRRRLSMPKFYLQTSFSSRWKVCRSKDSVRQSVFVRRSVLRAVFCCFSFQFVHALSFFTTFICFRSVSECVYVCACAFTAQATISERQRTAVHERTLSLECFFGTSFQSSHSPWFFLARNSPPKRTNRTIYFIYHEWIEQIRTQLTYSHNCDESDLKATRTPKMHFMCVRAKEHTNKAMLIVSDKIKYYTKSRSARQTTKIYIFTSANLISEIDAISVI